MFRPLYDWTLRLAGHRHAERSMAAIAFAESSFFPIPPDVMIVPMILADRSKAYRIATICTIASVLGGVVGYAIGYFLYDSVGQWLMRVYGMTPIPYKVVTIASGFAAFNFPLFMITSIITRGARFFILAWLLQRFGEPVQKFIEKRINLVGTLLLVVVVGGFVLAGMIG